MARGVQMEAESVEDQGEGICFNVYVYNDQPGITIDYATGASSLEGDALPEDSTQKEPEDTLYILNTSSGKFHLPLLLRRRLHERGEPPGLFRQP